MAFLNKVMLICRLAADPEAPRTVNNGSQVIKFRIAAGKSKKNAQGQWENDPNPLFIDCEAWTQVGSKFSLVNIIQQYAVKGKELYIEGRLQLDQWDDKASGQKRSKHKIVVDQVQFLGGAQEQGQQHGQRQAQAQASQARNPDADMPPDSYQGSVPGYDDSIPF